MEYIREYDDEDDKYVPTLVEDDSDDEDDSDSERNLRAGNIKVGAQSPSCSNHQCSTCSPLYNSGCEPECEPECDDEYIAHSV